MVDPARNLNQTQSTTGLQVYEMPLTERMRTFLRLEFLFQQTRYHSAGESKWSSRAAVTGLLEILSIIGRGDIRSEALKELERNSKVLSRFQCRPEVDTQRLEMILGSITKLREQLQSSGSQIAQELRENEFLNSIKHRSAIPGGTCEFDLPDYNHWLSQSHERRLYDLSQWADGLRPLRDGVCEVLWLTRESTQPTREMANSGLYQHVLDRGAPCHLIRVSLPPHTRLFPEISGSQHRFTIRFLRWDDVGSRPEHVSEDVSFLLSCC